MHVTASKSWHDCWHSGISVLPASRSGAGPESCPGACPLEGEPKPHAVWIASQALLFTQSIWYWYAFWVHAVSHAACSPTGRKLHVMALVQALAQSGAETAVGAGGSGGAMSLRHVGSQMAECAQLTNRLICASVAPLPSE